MKIFPETAATILFVATVTVGCSGIDDENIGTEKAKAFARKRVSRR